MSTPSTLHPFAVPTRERADFLPIVRGEGARIWDDTGASYLDGTAALWFCNVGHGRQELAEVAARQMETLAAFHSFTRFTNDVTERLAERIIGLAGIDRARVLLTSGGSDAVDATLKLVRMARDRGAEPDRTVVIARTPSYHGVTLAASTLTGLEAVRTGFGPLIPDVVHVPHDDAHEVARVIDELGAERVAAVIAEPVIGAGGLIPPAEGYLDGLRAICDRSGAWLIFDEVITAFGRLGEWTGAERFGVTPDALTFAKGVTSGYLPLGGVILGAEIRDRLERPDAPVMSHGSTYAGHPTCAAVALANLDIIEREDLRSRARSAGQTLRNGLDALIDRDDVREVRGDGLMQAVVLADPQQAPAATERLLARGVIGRALPAAGAIAFSPWLGIADDDIHELVAGVTGALDDVQTACLA